MPHVVEPVRVAARRDLQRGEGLARVHLIRRGDWLNARRPIHIGAADLVMPGDRVLIRVHRTGIERDADSQVWGQTVSIPMGVRHQVTQVQRHGRRGLQVREDQEQPVAGGPPRQNLRGMVLQRLSDSLHEPARETEEFRIGQLAVALHIPEQHRPDRESRLAIGAARGWPRSGRAGLVLDRSIGIPVVFQGVPDQRAALPRSGPGNGLRRPSMELRIQPARSQDSGAQRTQTSERAVGGFVQAAGLRVFGDRLDAGQQAVKARGPGRCRREDLATYRTRTGQDDVDFPHGLQHRLDEQQIGGRQGGSIAAYDSRLGQNLFHFALLVLFPIRHPGAVVQVLQDRR